jgi:hypothetical protein
VPKVFIRLPVRQRVAISETGCRAKPFFGCSPGAWAHLPSPGSQAAVAAALCPFLAQRSKFGGAGLRSVTLRPSALSGAQCGGLTPPFSLDMLGPAGAAPLAKAVATLPHSKVRTFGPRRAGLSAPPFRRPQLKLLKMLGRDWRRAETSPFRSAPQDFFSNLLDTPPYRHGLMLLRLFELALCF